MIFAVGEGMSDRAFVVDPFRQLLSHPRRQREIFCDVFIEKSIVRVVLQNSFLNYIM
jgi:hypothetical protein